MPEALDGLDLNMLAIRCRKVLEAPDIDPGIAAEARILFQEWSALLRTPTVEAGAREALGGRMTRFLARTKTG
ncbi:MAG TPA: hypothetical protein VL128_18730 [Candidatus Eisenbacteria bacterium]|nr:hypothetical protein [Candidatus Eisenbacteria bacterium]